MATDFAPKLDLNVIEKTIQLPDLKAEKELPETIDDLAVVLKSADLDKLPDFLSKVIGESSYMQEDLKKKKSLLIYGRTGDKFKRCVVRVSSFSDYYTTLSDAGTLTRTLLGQGVPSSSIYFGSGITSDQISTFLQGVCLTNYKFDRKGDSSASFKKISSVTVYNSEYDITTEKNQHLINTAKYPLFCREVLNSRALEANPQNMLDLCKQIAQNNSKIAIETIVGKELQEKGLNLIYSVGRGSVHPSSLVILKYQGNPEKPEDIISFIGKGVCFDAGGLNIKGTGSIESMFNDKGGACTVLAAFRGLVELNVPVNIVCSLAFVENLVGPDAVHPLDIIKSHKGLTVEIGNTDAEGRLILADAMSYTQAHYKPHTMIEMSTLTGAIRAAIGGSLAGLFTNSDKLGKELKKAGKESGENLWKMPLLAEHKASMKGAHGDLNNKSKLNGAGASTAAGFLENFVEKGVQWAHLDIAAVKTSDAEKHVYAVGANGWGVQLLFNFVRNRLQAKEEIKPSEKVEAGNVAEAQSQAQEAQA